MCIIGFVTLTVLAEGWGMFVRFVRTSRGLISLIALGSVGRSCGENLVRTMYVHCRGNYCKVATSQVTRLSV